MQPKILERLVEVLFEIGKAIGSEDEVLHLFDTISERVCELTGADACSIMMLDASRQCLLGKAAYGLEDGRIQTLSFRVGEGVAGWVAEHGQPALIDDCASDPRFVHLLPSSGPDNLTRIRSMACVPLVARGERVGVLTATSGALATFTAAHLEILEFIAKTIALDVENLRLRRVSVTDPLTGAFNREFLQRRLPSEITAAEQRGKPLAVAMIDVDHFKAVNDRYGHATGDQVLAEVASRIRAAIRRDDLLVRYGGEEFLVVLPDADLERARDVAERIRGNLMRESVPLPDDAGGGGLEVRVSVGVAAHGGGDAGALVARADSALYRAKGRGRNRVEVAA